MDVSVETATASPTVDQQYRTRPLRGRPIHTPVAESLFVGGAITVPIFIATYFFPALTPTSDSITFRTFLVFNGAHFAASTVRLYTKPGAQKEFPILSRVFPFVCLAVVGLALWSPFVGR